MHPIYSPPPQSASRSTDDGDDEVNSDKHKAKMAAKKARNLLPTGRYASATSKKRLGNYLVSRTLYKACNAPPASINRHTGKPHEHRREIARNLSRAA